MARWCARFGANVRVWDSREEPANAPALAKHVPDAQWVRGPLTDEALVDVKLVLKSPGLSPSDERIAPTLNRAADTGVLVQGEVELFARALADLKTERGYAPKVLAITGTNGKTTTTAMTAMLIERTGRRVAMAGNIGPTMLQTLADALDLEPVVTVGEAPALVDEEAEAVAAVGGPHPGPLPEGDGEDGDLPRLRPTRGLLPLPPTRRPLPLGEGRQRRQQRPPLQPLPALMDPQPPPAPGPTRRPRSATSWARCFPPSRHAGRCVR
jgi:UDP-N-acetylmuramoylalanine--D-glutamate ligase